MLRAAERGQQLLALTLVETEQRVNICAAIAIFGEETGQRLCRMVSAHHHAAGHPGDAVLGFHPLTGLFVAAYEVAQFNARVAQRFFAGQHRFFNIYGQHAIRLDEGDGILTILLIELYAVRQTHRDKLQGFIACFCTQFADGHLGELPGEGGVLTAANAQHQRLQKREAG